MTHRARYPDAGRIPSENITRILGLGFDHRDGHVRITQGESFGILLGSEKTHREMEQFCLALEQRLAEQGQRMQDLSRDEFLALVRELNQPPS